jgi:hypothetical protein
MQPCTGPNRISGTHEWRAGVLALLMEQVADAYMRVIRRRLSLAKDVATDLIDLSPHSLLPCPISRIFCLLRLRSHIA